MTIGKVIPVPKKVKKKKRYEDDEEKKDTGGAIQKPVAPAVPTHTRRTENSEPPSKLIADARQPHTDHETS